MQLPGIWRADVKPECGDGVKVGVWMTAKKSLPSAGNIPKEKTQTGDLQHSRDKIDFFGDGWKLWRKFYSTDQFQIHSVSDLFFLLRTLHTCSLEPLLIDSNYNTFRWCMHALKVNVFPNDLDIT